MVGRLIMGKKSIVEPLKVHKTTQLINKAREESRRLPDTGGIHSGVPHRLHVRSPMYGLAMVAASRRAFTSPLDGSIDSGANCAQKASFELRAS